MTPAVSSADIDVLYDILAETTTPLVALHRSLLARTAASSSAVRRFNLACALALLLAPSASLLPAPGLRVNALYLLHELDCFSETVEPLPETHTWLALFLVYAKRPPAFPPPGQQAADEQSWRPTLAERWLATLLLTTPRAGFRDRTAESFLTVDQNERSEANPIVRELNAGRMQSTLTELAPHALSFDPRPSALFAPSPSQAARGWTVDKARTTAKRAFEQARLDYGDDYQLLDMFATDEPGSTTADDVAGSGSVNKSTPWTVPPLVEDAFEWDRPRASDETGPPPTTTAAPAHIKIDHALRELCNSALTAPLTPTQQHSVITAFESHDPATLVSQTGLTPETLPDLIECNPNVATALLLRLIEARTDDANVYLSVLVSINMSLHSLEVVNRLASQTLLPDDFLRLYVVHCIEMCDRSRDRYIQNRQVRLVCVFLQSLLRNKTIAIPAPVEIQAFCIQHSRVREAAGLFRMLKKETA
ncbi:hypothetical protein HDU86_007612 [Geranomyces michiganensis]|nr:hypothetical protein HDU86_007612 [Geranomyces michiganensis]